MAAMVCSEAALADPKPTPVDIKAYKDKLLVLTDAKGGIFAVARTDAETIVFYGSTKDKLLYQQRVTSRSTNGAAWSVGMDAPRLAEIRPGEIVKREDGTYQAFCDGKDDRALTEITGDKAKAVLDKAQFLTTADMRVPVALGRDNSGVYYYVDRLIKQYGGAGYRVFIGKKGAMKLTQLADVAVDTAGEVFSTKTGDLRLVHGTDATGEWVRGTSQPTKLTMLNVDISTPLIFSGLGIYTFLGTICDSVTY